MTLPVSPVTYPAALNGVENGRIPPSKLVTVASLHGGNPVVLLAVAARCFVAMRAAAEKAGVRLESVSSYRTYAGQEVIFRERYVPHFARHTDGTVSYRIWNEVRWYHAFGATAAVPGTSNHGRGLAVDFVRSAAWLIWMLAHADEFGWSWEIQEEEWHLRYFAGDEIPQAVLDYEHAQHPPAPTPADPEDDETMFFYDYDFTKAGKTTRVLVQVTGEGQVRLDGADVGVKARAHPSYLGVAGPTMTGRWAARHGPILGAPT